MKQIYSALKAALLAMLVLAFPGCKWFKSTSGECACDHTSTQSRSDLKEVTAEQLKEKMTSTLGLLVINVLPEEGFKECHIKGSVNVPMADLEKVSETWDKNQEIIVYCASEQCPLSKQAQALLQSKGFTNVAHYAGGTREWVSKNDATNYPCGGEKAAQQ